MNRKIVKACGVFMSVLMLCTPFTGCNIKKDAATGNSEPNLQNAEYPLKTNVTLKYWMGLTPSVASSVSDFSQTPFAKELEKETGVKIQYIHPPQGQVSESFNIMLAGGDLPDIIDYDWYNFPGGPEKAIQDEYIIKLNDVINQYAPNLKKYLQQHTDVDKMVKTDSGNYYVFPFIRGDDMLMVSNGPMIRKDWLDDLGMQVPTTMDEWDSVLRAFKERKGATAPLSFQSSVMPYGPFVGAYGTTKNFFVENGQVKYGPVENGYKDFLATFAKWYKEGLLDSNIATVDAKMLDSGILNNQTGATVAFAGSGMGKWLSAMKEKDPKFNLVAAPYPTLNKGDIPKFGQRDLAYTPNNSAAITKACKNVEVAARVLDYAYGEKGTLLFNFGTEGESYKMVNGYPTYTELVMKNPQGQSVSQALAQYTRAINNGPFIQDKRYLEQYFELPQQKDAVNTWIKTDAVKHVLPRSTPTQEESTAMSKIMNDVNTYVDEMYLKFIMGVEPIENFDQYVEQVKKLGIEKAISIQQAALDRYNKR